jgi:AraC-like DNA-binding protein
MEGEKREDAGGGAGPRTLLDTRDIDEAREIVGTAYCPHSLDLLRGDREFHAVQREATVGTIAVHSLEYGATMLVDPVPLGSWLLVSSPVRGRLQIRSGREERTLGVGETVVLDPFRKFSLCFTDDCRLRTIRFDRHLVERVLGEVSEANAPRVEFGLGAPRTLGAASIWQSVSGLLERQALTMRQAADYPLLLAELERTAVAALIETHPLRYRPGTAPAGRVLPARIRRAVAIIEAEPDRAFRTADLAAAAGLSGRALQEAFRRHLATTPLGYVREVRLRRAHEDLMRADAGSGATVAEVAYRWGFGNLGRFARVYADRYGRHPSETLRR